MEGAGCGLAALGDLDDNDEEGGGEEDDEDEESGGDDELAGAMGAMKV